MFNFIQNFLKPRSFKVKVMEIPSDTKAQTKNIPQTSVARHTFFKLKINKILGQLLIDNKFQISLYIDALQISYHPPKWKVVERMYQDSINYVKKFALNKNSFKFSTSKTFMLHFTKLKQ